jgi:ABC-type glycerol-3-phosphate transport system permease component
VELTPAQRAVRVLVLAVGLAYALVPVFWVLAIALRPRSAFTFPLPLMPTSFTLSNLHDVLLGSEGIGWLPYLNAAIYGAGAAVVTALVALLGGYALGRYDSRVGRSLLLVFLALSLLPDAARIVPLFLLYIHTGLYDTRIGIVLAYAAGSLPLAIWLMAAIVRQIPIRLEQAARIDGAGPLTVARRIVFPLARPGVLVVGTLAFINGWNAFSLPLILAQSSGIQPYTVVLQKYIIVESSTVNWTLLSAGSLIGLVPVLLVFGVLQRRLISQGGLGAAVGTA